VRIQKGNQGRLLVVQIVVHDSDGFLAGRGKNLETQNVAQLRQRLDGRLFCGLNCLVGCLIHF